MSDKKDDRRGLLLMGHGTTDPVGQAEFMQTVAMVRESCQGLPVEGGYLELAEPTIRAGVENLVARGITQIVAVPVLLFAAGHAKEDIPRELAAAIGQNPGVSVQQTRPLECHPEILALSAERFFAALRSAGVSKSDHSDRTLWLLVGRGSSDAEAIAKVHEFAAARRRLTPLGEAAVAFVAAAKPRLGDALAAAGAYAGERIVVQPHLLFHGAVRSEIDHQVSEAAQRYPAKQWLVTEHLGVSPNVVRAILDLANRA